MNKDIRAYNALLTKEDKKICNLLAKEIDAGLLKHKEIESKIWHRSPVWFQAGNPIVGYAKRKADVQLLFWSGQSFEESGLEPEGTFKAAQVRYVDVSEVNTKSLQRWLKKAVKVQWDYKNIVKRQGKLEPLTGMKNKK